MPKASGPAGRSPASESLGLTGAAALIAALRASLSGRGDLAGLLLMATSAAAFALMAAFVKLLLPDTPAQAIVLSRGLLMTGLFAAIARTRNIPLRGRRTGVLLIRGLLGYVAISCYFASVQRLPLGDAVLIQYSHPLFVAILAPLLLRETTAKSHWWLVLLALAGVALIVGPTGSIRKETLVGLAGSAASGLAYMVVRSLSRTEHPLTIVIWFTAATVPGAIAGTLAAGSRAIPRSAAEVAGHLAVFGAGLLGQVTLTLGLARASAARATAASLSGPVFGLAYGFLLVRQTPSGTTLAGAAIVLSALGLLAFRGPPRTTGTAAAADSGPHAAERPDVAP